MNKVLLFAILLLLFNSCSDEERSLLMKELKDCDRVKIYFYKDGGSTPGGDNMIFTIDSKDTIQMFLDGISDESTPKLKCGYNGSIEFFRGGESVKNMEFNLMPECRHIVFSAKQNYFSKRLNDKGLILLNSYKDKIIK